jgi:hypothetical protein
MAPVSEKQSSVPPRKATELRRSQRVLLRVPIVVMGQSSTGAPFSEETITLVVNAHGALITMTTKPEVRQKLGIVNLSSGEELACHVVHLGAIKDGKTEVAIEFVSPAPFFWRISFPPSDWGARP